MQSNLHCENSLKLIPILAIIKLIPIRLINDSNFNEDNFQKQDA